MIEQPAGARDLRLLATDDPLFGAGLLLEQVAESYLGLGMPTLPRGKEQAGD